MFEHLFVPHHQSKGPGVGDDYDARVRDTARASILSRAWITAVKQRWSTGSIAYTYGAVDLHATAKWKAFRDLTIILDLEGLPTMTVEMPNEDGCVFSTHCNTSNGAVAAGCTSKIGLAWHFEALGPFPMEFPDITYVGICHQSDDLVRGYEGTHCFSRLSAKFAELPCAQVQYTNEPCSSHRSEVSRPPYDSVSGQNRVHDGPIESDQKVTARLSGAECLDTLGHLFTHFKVQMMKINRIVIPVVEAYPEYSEASHDVVPSS
ncbi:hypothetical protein J1614_006064 [Plenodomus biglobosus]|nr:hypothetical protein J1614_006064 [Plenodomus biglobosus]